MFKNMKVCRWCSITGASCHRWVLGHNGHSFFLSSLFCQCLYVKTVYVKLEGTYSVLIFLTFWLGLKICLEARILPSFLFLVFLLWHICFLYLFINLYSMCIHMFAHTHVHIPHAHVEVKRQLSLSFHHVGSGY